MGCKTCRGRSWQGNSVQVTSGQDTEVQIISGQVRAGHGAYCGFSGGTYNRLEPVTNGAILANIIPLVAFDAIASSVPVTALQSAKLPAQYTVPTISMKTTVMATKTTDVIPMITIDRGMSA